MKWIAFFGMAVVGAPLMFCLAQISPRSRRILFAILVFTTCIKLSVNFVSSEWYRGPDRGFEVTVTDLIALALGVSLLARRSRQVKWLPPTTIPMMAFFAMAMVSTAGFAIPLLGWFSLFKLAKAYWLYWVVYNTFVLEPPEAELWYGLMGIAYYETYLCLKQKYVYGLYRVYGSFDHSNSIPIYLIMFTPLLLAWIFNGKHLNRFKSVITLGALGGCCVAILTTQSRAGLVLTGAALGVTLLRIVPHRLNGRKAGIAALFIVLTVLGLVKAAPTIIQRFKEAPEQSELAREEFNEAAKAMQVDHLFGVGYNLFSHAMTNESKYKQFAEVMGNEEHAGVCHHIYHLTAAETGTVGLVMFLWVMAAIQFRLFYRIWGQPDFAHCVVVSVFIGLGVVHVIGLLEWCFRLTPQTNMFMIVAAMGQAYCHHIAVVKKAAKQAKKEARALRRQTQAEWPGGASSPAM